MEREKPTFDILGRIERERLSRGWSENALAENSGLTQSTISTWRRRNLQPNVASLEKICSGLGISLSQFFQDVLHGFFVNLRFLFFQPFHQFEVRIWSHNLSVSNFGGGGPAYRTFVAQVVGV